MKQVKEIFRSVFVQKIVKNTFWLTLGSFVSKGLVVLAYLVLARILSVDEYGEYGMVKATIDNFLIFATMGVGITVTKFVAELKTTQTLIASRILGSSLLLVSVLGIILFILIALLSRPLATTFLENDNLAMPLLVSGSILLFIAIGTVLQGALLGLQQTKQLFFVQLIQGVLLLVGLSVGGYFFGVIGAIIGNLIAIVCMALVAYLMLQKSLEQFKMTILVQDVQNTLKKISRFAIPASLAMLVGAPAIWLLNTQLVRLPNGYEELGIYSAVIIFSLAIRTLNTAISNAVLPVFLDDSLVMNPKKQFFNYHGAWLICFLVALPLVLIPEIASWLLGPKYPLDKVSIILSLTLFSTLCFSFKQGISRDLIKQNKMWYSAFSMLFWAIVVFSVFYFLKPLGAVGFAIAFCSGYFANVVVAVPFYIYKKITPKYVFSSVWLFVLVLLILLVFAINLFLESFLIRFFGSFAVLLLIFISVKKFYSQLLDQNKV